MSASPFQWPSASVVWTPEGYLLRVPAYLDARAVSMMALAEVPGARVEFELEPAVWTETDGRGASVEPGELRIKWQELPKVPVEAIREPLDRAAEQAVQEAEQATERDKQIVDRWLSELHHAG